MSDDVRTPKADETGADEAADPAAAEAPERALPAHPVLRGLLERFEDVEWRLSAGQHVVVVPREGLRAFAEATRDAGFEMCADVTAVDHLRNRRDRFELVVNLLSVSHRLRLRILVPIPAADPVVDSLVPVWRGANFFEREVYDMFGIEFRDHPDLTRILMPDDWEGHPLRKDFAVGAVPVQFKSDPEAV